MQLQKYENKSFALISTKVLPMTPPGYSYWQAQVVCSFPAKKFKICWTQEAVETPTLVIEELHPSVARSKLLPA